MAVVATFLVNLLCSVVSCDPSFTGPEIMDHIETGQSTIFNQVLELEPHVDTRYGSLEGYVMKTIGNRRIHAFEGVPYAEPPLGFHARFQTAQPKEPWHGKRQAKHTGPECLQLSIPKVIRVLGSEDCLYLNVYTPQVPYIDEFGHQVFFEPFPVIVSFHGGGYFFGSGNELGPSYLLDKDVILVTFNYRLGVLGFMSSGDSFSPGNYGLKDQAMAIQWVYDNIASFGGNPNKITLIGHSAGGSAIHLHLIANKTTQYFQSGVSLSGTAYTPWAIKSRKESRRLTETLAKAVFCPITDTGDMVDCLKRRNPVELVYAQYKLFEFLPFPQTLFSPVIERPGPDSYLTKKPDVAYARNEVARKPWIFGFTAQEGYLGILFLQSFVLEGMLRNRWDELAPTYLDYKYTSRNVTETTRKLTKFYFGNRTPQNVPENKLAAIFGDRLFLPGINKAIKFQSAVAPTYCYIFGFKGKYTLGSRVGRDPSDWGVGHGDDLYYFFNSSTWLPGFTKADTDEYSMSKIMISMLSNFATRGEPLMTQSNNVDVRVWEPVNPTDIWYLQLNRQDVKMVAQPYKKRLKFWHRLAQDDPKLLNPLYDASQQYLSVF